MPPVNFFDILKQILKENVNIGKLFFLGGTFLYSFFYIHERKKL